MTGHVFLSYSHAGDSDYIGLLAEHLGRHGVAVWFDRDIVSGDRWTSLIREKIDSCIAMVVVMSPVAEESAWVNREIIQAEETGKPVYPLLLKGRRFFRLADVQYEDVSGGRMPSARFIDRLRSHQRPSGFRLLGNYALPPLSLLKTSQAGDGDLVRLGDVLRSAAATSRHPLTVAFGRDKAGHDVVVSLPKLPHLLTGGAAGSGKSMFLSALLLSILVRATPEQVKLLLIDPKRVDLTLFESVPHLAIPIITNPVKAVTAFKQVCGELDSRYDKLAGTGVRNIDDYNRTATGNERLPYLLMVVDELADLMFVAPREIQDSIEQITQLGHSRTVRRARTTGPGRRPLSSDGRAGAQAHTNALGARHGNRCGRRLLQAAAVA